MLISKFFYKASTLLFQPIQTLFQSVTPESFIETKNSVFDGQEVVDEQGAESRLVQVGRCYAPDGIDDFINAPHLIGTETITSFLGTSTPTISAGRIDFTAGTIWSIEIDDGTFYKCDEVGGTVAYDSSGNNNDGTITNANLATFHSILTDGNGADFQNQVGYTPAMVFDGTDSRIDLEDTDNLLFADDSFTIEAYVNVTNTTNRHVIYADYRRDATSASDTGMLFRVREDGSVNFSSSLAGSYENVRTTANVITPNTWYHVSIVRDGNDLEIFVDGNSEATGTTTRSYGHRIKTIGALFNNNAYAQNFNGQIKALRITKSALYTANFTPPTQYSDYTIDDNTSLFLLHGNWDESCYQNTITENGNQNICIPRDESNTTQDATGGNLFFVDRVKYNARLVNSAVLDFDGVNDIVRIPHSTDFDFGTDDFTIDLWVRYRDGERVFYFGNNARTSSASGVQFPSWTFHQNTTNVLDFIYWTGVGTITGRLTSPVITGIADGELMHVAITRDATNTARFFINGVEIESGTVTTNITANTNPTFSVGGAENGLNAYSDFNGFNVRVTNGTALWTDNFCPPKRYDTLHADTVLFLPMQEGENNIVYDVSGNANNGTLTNFTIPTAWTNETQDFCHYNLFQGFELYTDDATGLRELRVPAQPNGTFLTPTIAGWTKQSEHSGSYYHNGAETEFRNYQAPELINEDVANYLFDGAGNPNDISFTDMIADRGAGKITTDIINTDTQKENHEVNTNV